MYILHANPFYGPNLKCYSVFSIVLYSASYRQIQIIKISPAENHLEIIQYQEIIQIKDAYHLLSENESTMDLSAACLPWLQGTLDSPKFLWIFYLYFF